MVSVDVVGLANNHTVQACVALGLLVLLVIQLTWRPLERWRLRKIPGSWGLPLIGDLIEASKYDMPKLLTRMQAKYGPVYKMWIGNVPSIIVCDPDIARRVLFKLGWRGPVLNLHSTASGEALEMERSSVFASKGDLWKLARKSADASLISTASLSAHIPVMDQCAIKLCDRLLRKASATGPSDADAGAGVVAGMPASPNDAPTLVMEPIDIYREFGALTLAVMGECAFGVDFHTLDDEVDACDPIGRDTLPSAAAAAARGHGGSANAVRAQGTVGVEYSADAGRRLVWACREIFKQTRTDMAPIYLPLQIMFPDQVRLVKWLAKVVSSPVQRRGQEARNVLISVSRELINSWQAAHGKGAAKAAGAAGGAGDKAAAADTATKDQGDFQCDTNRSSSSSSVGSAVMVEQQHELIGTTGSKPVLPSLGTISTASSGITTNIATSGSGTPSTIGTGGSPIRASSLLAQLLEERRCSGDNAVQKLTDLQVISNCFIMILAGYETTASLMAFATYAILKHPHVEARVLAEVNAYGRDRPLTCYDDLNNNFPYLEAVLKETLRLYSPATGSVRFAEEEVEVAGYKVPKNTMLFIHAYGFEKDTAYWPRPLEFLPERFLQDHGSGDESKGLAPNNANAYMPFGAGARMCVGHRFAFLETKLVLVRLLQRLHLTLHPRTADQQPLKTATGVSHTPEAVWVNVQLR